jgi:hypothetical protein
LLLTTPYLRRIPQSMMDFGPFPDFEDGRHVRRGYSRAMLADLCRDSGLVVEEISFLSGPASQISAFVLHGLESRIPQIVAWTITLPLRVLPPLLDWFFIRIGAPPFTIGLEAYKPRVVTTGTLPQANTTRPERTPPASI